MRAQVGKKGHQCCGRGGGCPQEVGRGHASRSPPHAFKLEEAVVMVERWWGRRPADVPALAPMPHPCMAGSCAANVHACAQLCCQLCGALVHKPLQVAALVLTCHSWSALHPARSQPWACPAQTPRGQRVQARARGVSGPGQGLLSSCGLCSGFVDWTVLAVGCLLAVLCSSAGECTDRWHSRWWSQQREGVKAEHKR